MKQPFKNLLLFFIVFLVIAGIFSTFTLEAPAEEIGITKLIEEIEAGEVQSISVTGQEALITLHSEDEQSVIDCMYENPMFVEEVVRTALSRLKACDNFTWYRIEAENSESIHNHGAYAMIEKDFEPVPKYAQTAVFQRLK